MFLEAGFARSRETVNVLLECIVDTCLCGLLFWAFGFAFMFGSGNGLIGHTFFFLNNPPTTYPAHGRRVLRLLAVPVRLRRHLLDGHLGRHGRPHRLRRRPDLQHRRVAASSTRSSATGSGVRAAGWPPGPTRCRSTTSPARRSCTRSAASSRWPAPSSSDHASGRKFKRDGGGAAPSPRPDHRGRRRRHPLVRLVRLQPRLDAVRHGLRRHGRVAANTTLAACAGGLSAMFFMYPDGQEVGPRHHRQRLPGRPGGHHLSLLLGQPVRRHHASALVAGVVVIARCRPARVPRASTIPIGAWPVHGLCGIWGTLSLGLFATGQYAASRSARTDRRRLQGPVLRRWRQAAARPVHRQPAMCAATFARRFIMFKIIDAFGILRGLEGGRARRPRPARARHRRLPRGVRLRHQLHVAAERGRGHGRIAQSGISEGMTGP